MKRVGVFLVAVLSACSLFAERQVGFGVESFLALAPTGQVRSLVFSPAAFEVDCAVASEAFDPIRRAAIAESIGVMTGWTSVYQPMAERYAEAATNGLDFLSARAFLVPSHRLVDPRFRTRMRKDWGAAVCPVRPSPAGAENWFRVSLDGRMEDFRLGAAELAKDAVSFRGLAFVDCAWERPFAASAETELAFAAPDGVRKVPALRDVRRGGLWETKAFTLLRLPMAGDAQFFAMLPAPGRPLDSLRASFNAGSVLSLLATVDSLTEPGVYRGLLDVALPRFELASENDLEPVFARFRLALEGFVSIKAEGGFRSFRQFARFRLGGRGGLATDAGPDSASRYRVAAPPRAIALDRPFLFFVYHVPTRSMPVLGIYAGESQK